MESQLRAPDDPLVVIAPHLIVRLDREQMATPLQRLPARMQGRRTAPSIALSSGLGRILGWIRNRISR